MNDQNYDFHAEGKFPAHCDERAERFFSRVFVGKSVRGADKYGYTYSWNSRHADLQPTSTLQQRGAHSCSFCGRAALPIQNSGDRFAGYDYSVTGYTCICSGAMDELDWIVQAQRMKKRHQEEVEEMLLQRPVPPKDVRQELTKNRLMRLLSDVENSNLVSAMRLLEITSNRPPVWNESYEHLGS
ncbi:hypothetical protein TQVEPAJM_CDS0073 [Pseudomonas phage VB_PaN_phPA-Intesti]|uniref:Uncharacterized protein n=1 Tax=Pseudomonas phage PAP-JP TaxID=2583508 RepID=A0A5C1K4Z5_9CAUD|nr:hypothetical protein PAPJP_074 [Pseudomonas phage PAP-JP]